VVVSVERDTAGRNILRATSKATGNHLRLAREKPRKSASKRVCAGSGPSVHTKRNKKTFWPDVEAIVGRFLEPWSTCGAKREAIAAKLEAEGRIVDAVSLQGCGRRHYLAVTEAESGREVHPFGIERCRHVLCPSCSRVKAQNYRRRVFDAIEAQEVTHPGLRSLFVTFTPGPNATTAKEARVLISKMRKALTEIRRIRRYGRKWLPWIGGLTSLEITGDDARGYHPHLHMLAFVQPEYFDRSEALWVTQRELQNAWEQALGVDLAIVDIRTTTGKLGEDDDPELANHDPRTAAVEAIKYAVKPGDLAAASPKWVAGLLQAVRGQRAYAPFGLLRRHMKAAEPISEEEELEALEDDGKPERRVIAVCAVAWNGRVYESSKMTTEEEATAKARAIELFERPPPAPPPPEEATSG